MAVVYNSNQVKWGDRGYLDAKMQPVANLAALPSDPTEVFEGMTVVVLNDGSGEPHDYWRVNGAWVKKSSGGNEFTDEEKNKLAGIEAGAQVNVQADWSAASGASAILNKPDLTEYAQVSDLANYAEKSDLDAYAEKSDLDAYAQKSDLDAYAEKSDLDAYAEKSDLDAYAQKSDLDAYAEKSDLDAYAEKSDLDAYAQKSDLDAYAEKADLDAYATKTDLDDIKQEAIDDAIVAAAEYVDEQGFLAATALTEALQDYVKTDDLNDYAKTDDLNAYAKANEVQEAFDAVATAMTASYEAAVSAATEAATQAVEGEGYMKEDAVLSAITDAVSVKQDELEAGDGIAIENDTVRVLFDGVTIKVNDAGNLYAVGGGGQGGSYSPGQYIKIEDSVISVTGITPDEYATKAELSAETESRTNADEALASEIEVLNGEVSAMTAAIQEKADKDDLDDLKAEAVAEAVSAATDNMVDYVEVREQAILSAATEAATEAAAEAVEQEGYMKEDDVLSAITASVADKQDKLEAGENITIENNVISANVDLSGYATSADLEDAVSALTAHVESAKDDAIAEAVALVQTEGYATEAFANSAATEALESAKEYVDDQEFAKADDIAAAVSAATENLVTKDDLDDAVSEAVSAATQDAVTANDLEEAKAAATADAVAEIDARGYVDDEFVASAITASENEVKEWVNDQNFITEHQDISGKMDAFEAGDGLKLESGKLDVLVDDTTIKINNAGKLYAIGGGGGGSTIYSPGQYISIQDNVISVSGITPDDYATKDEVASAETAALEAAKAYVVEQDYATVGDVQEALDEIVANATTAITEAQENAVAESKLYVDSQNFVKPEDVASAVTEALEAADYASKADVEAFADDVATAITASHEAAVNETKQYVDEQDFVKPEDVASAVTAAVEAGNYMSEDDVNSAITAAIATKQDKLEAGKNITIEENVISADFDIDLDDYATKEDLASSATDTLEAAKDYVDRGDFASKSDVEAFADDVATAITASHEAAVSEAKEYVDEQKFATSEELESASTEMQQWVNEQKFATSEEVASAVTEAMEASDYMTEDDVLSAITASVADKQDKLTAGDNIAIENNVISVVGLDFSDYATKDELTSAATEALQGAMDYVDGQNFATQEDIADAVSAATADFVTDTELDTAIAEAVSAATENMPTQTDLENAVAEAVSAATEAVGEEGYAKDEDVATAITASLNSAKTYTDNAITGITHPEYTIASAASQQYAAVYDLKKDGSAITNSVQIRIPKGAELANELVADVAVGNVSAGTVFAAGTSIESILRQIFTSSAAPTGQTRYAYYGSIGWDDAMYDEDEAPITEAGIKSLCTRSAGEVSVDEPIVFTVRADDYEIIIAVPATFTLLSVLDIDHAMTSWTQEFQLKKQMVMDGINYNIYSYDQDSPLTQFRMQITLQNA